MHFVIDLSYAGLFGLATCRGGAAPFLLIEAPRLLFPFARQIIAEAVTNMRLPAAAARPDRLHGGLCRRCRQQQQGTKAAGSASRRQAPTRPKRGPSPADVARA